MPFIPHTDAETKAMLKTIGVDSIDELYDEIPPSLRTNDLPGIPEGMNEFEVKQLIQNKMAKDKLGKCFIGAGSYEHHIPSVVNALISRGEFLTAYTPYQAEASQGNLQLIYEFQSMIASLMGLEVANASVYDGACALTEAVLMAIRIKKTKDSVVLIPRNVHPSYRKVVRSIVKQQGIEIQEIDYDLRTGHVLLGALKAYEGKKIAALIIPQPNFFGVIEEVDQLTDWAHAQDALVIGVVNPTAMSLLKEPGKWGKQGADIACGEGQPLGIPLASGGPYFGFMACKMKYIRQMPGRIVGRTVDLAGNTGFTLTLQAREQHIRRAKATSNICTNQGLMVTAATIYMSMLGSYGLRQVAEASHSNARYLRNNLLKSNLAEPLFDSLFFHEFIIRPEKSLGPLLQILEMAGIQAGYDLSDEYPELDPALLVCVTETKTEADLDYYCTAFEKALRRSDSLETV